MTEFALVAVGGMLGALARYLLAQWRTPGFPYAILIANVIGSFGLGVLLGGVSDATFLLLGVGFCGAFTTFSTFALDTLVLGREGRRTAAVMNVVASVAACVVAAAIGLQIGAVLFSQ